MSSNRPEKIADLLKREVSKILNQEVKDPRLQNINITAVKVTDDIGIAYIFYTIIGKSIKKNESKIEMKFFQTFLNDKIKTFKDNGN